MRLFLFAFVTVLSAVAEPRGFVDLFHQLDSRLPHGFYRIPGIVTSTNGTLLAFVMGRFHRTDMTPNIVYLRRSFDNGENWTPAQAVLSDPTNHTMYGGLPVVDQKTGSIHFLHNAADGTKCSACELKITSSHDHGATWSAPEALKTTGAANTTWGGGLASGISLTRGPKAGRLMAALRHDCGCGDKRTSFVVFSDDNGVTWAGGAEMVLLPQYGGGWTG